MTVDELIRFAAELHFYADKFGISAEINNGRWSEEQLADFVSSVLEMLPVVRAAAIATEAQSLSDPTARRNYENLVWRAVDAMGKHAAPLPTG